MTQVHAILACTDDHIVGKEDYIPWKMSADLKRFKELTSGHALLIGYRTFAGIVKHYPRPQLFPGRDVYVLADFKRSITTDENVHSHSLGCCDPEPFLSEMRQLAPSAGIDFNNITFIDTQSFWQYVHAFYGNNTDYVKLMIRNAIPVKEGQIIYIAGGASIYHQLLCAVDVIELTVVETKLKTVSKGAFNYDIGNFKLVELNDQLKKEMFSFNSPFKRKLIGKISKDDKNEYNASYYQLIRSLDGSTPINVLQGASAG